MRQDYAAEVEEMAILHPTSVVIELQPSLFAFIMNDLSDMSDLYLAYLISVAVYCFLLIKKTTCTININMFHFYSNTYKQQLIHILLSIKLNFSILSVNK